MCICVLYSSPNIDLCLLLFHLMMESSKQHSTTTKLLVKKQLNDFQFQKFVISWRFWNDKLNLSSQLSYQHELNEFSLHDYAKNEVKIASTSKNNLSSQHETQFARLKMRFLLFFADYFRSLFTKKAKILLFVRRVRSVEVVSHPHSSIDLILTFFFLQLEISFSFIQLLSHSRSRSFRIIKK